MLLDLHAPRFAPATFKAKITIGLLLVALLGVYALHLVGPGDMHRIDQPRTVSYTVDMVVNGRWFLPLDVEGHRATKPPLVNWLTAPLIAAGWHDQYAFWLPVMWAHLLTVVLLAWGAATLWRGETDAALPAERKAQLHGQSSPAMSWTLAGLAGLVFLASRYTAILPTYVRPDSLAMPLLAVGWLTATLLLEHVVHIGAAEGSKAAPQRRRILALELLFWLSVGLLALTKGALALYPLVYLILAARLLHGRFDYLLRTGWRWGLPLSIGLFLLWAIPAFFTDPSYFLKQLVGAETLGRFTGIAGIFGARPEIAQGPLDLLSTSWKIPQWYLGHLLPMSVLAIIGMFASGAWRRGHVLRPVVLWLVVTLALPLLSAGKTAQFIFPCAFPAAILAVESFRRPVENSRAVAVLIPALFALAALAFTAYYEFWGATHRGPTARNIQAFAREASRRVADEPVVFVDTGYNALKPLMGRSQPGPPPRDALDKAQWIVAPQRLAAGLHAQLSSGPIIIDRAGDAVPEVDSLLLIRADSVGPDHPLRGIAPARAGLQ